MEEDSAQNQPVEIPAQPPKPWLKIVLFVAVGVILVGGLVFAAIQIGKSSKLETQIAPLRQSFAGQAKLTPTQAPVATSTPILPPETTPLSDEIAAWKTYISKEGRFSLKYPQSLYIAPIRDDYNLFFEDEHDMQNTLICLRNWLAKKGYCSEELLSKMVLNIGVSSYGLDEYRKLDASKKLDILNPKEYKDGSGRIWTISDIIEVAGATNFAGTIETKSRVWEVGVQAAIGAFEHYLNRRLYIDLGDGKYDISAFLTEHDKIAKQILSTFRFLD